MAEEERFRWGEVPWENRKEAVDMIADSVPISEIEGHLETASKGMESIVEQTRQAAEEGIRHFMRDAEEESRNAQALNLTLAQQGISLSQRHRILDEALKERKYRVAEKAVKESMEKSLLELHSQALELEKKALSKEGLTPEEELRGRMVRKKFYDRMNRKEDIVPTGNVAEMNNAARLMGQHIRDLEGEPEAQEAVNRMRVIKGTLERRLRKRGFSEGRGWVSWKKEKESSARGR